MVTDRNLGGYTWSNNTAFNPDTGLEIPAMRKWQQTKRLTIEDPKPIFLNQVNNSAKKSGDFPNLTQEDISAISLSLQLGAELITDDFAMSNVAKNLGITIKPIMTGGIKRIGMWRYYCPACKINFSKSIECPNCGNNLMRKLIKKNQES